MDTVRRTSQQTLEPDHALFGLGYAKPVAERAYERCEGRAATTTRSAVAEETPVALVYNGRPHAVMMCTPDNIDDFALGFTLSEEIVERAGEIRNLNVFRHASGIEVTLTIPPERADALGNRGRSLVGRTGCGVCGIMTIDDALRPERFVAATRTVDVEAVYRAGEALPGLQHYNEATGAVHAAAWATLEGEIVLAREDVGRHNALDKLVGAMSRAQIDPAGGFAVLTSRASYELVQKCGVAGIALLATVSRPTGLAIRIAENAGITLAALLRGESVNVYSHPERIRLEPTFAS